MMRNQRARTPFGIPFEPRAVAAVVAILTLTMVGGCASDESNTPSVTPSATSSLSETSSPAPPSEIPPTRVDHPDLSGPAAESLAADLVSGDPMRVAAVLALPSEATADALDPALYAQLQALEPIALDQSSFRQLDGEAAQMFARVGPEKSEWTLYLIWENDRWTLVDAVEGRK